MKIYHGISANHRTPTMIPSVCLVYLYRFVFAERSKKVFSLMDEERRSRCFSELQRDFTFFRTNEKAVINLKVQFVFRLSLIDCLSFSPAIHPRSSCITTSSLLRRHVTVWCCWKWNHCNEADANFLETSSNDGRLNFTFCRSNATSERRNGCCRQCCRRWWAFIALLGLRVVRWIY